MLLLPLLRLLLFNDNALLLVAVELALWLLALVLLLLVPWDGINSWWL